MKEEFIFTKELYEYIFENDKEALGRLKFAVEYGLNSENKSENTSIISFESKKRISEIIAASQNVHEKIGNTLIYKEIISYLNEKTGKHFKNNTSKTKKSIEARLREGYKTEDFKKVIDVKCSDWIGGDFEKYLCPETLFGNKFEKYLNQTPKETPASSFDTDSFFENAVKRSYMDMEVEK